MSPKFAVYLEIMMNKKDLNEPQSWFKNAI